MCSKLDYIHLNPVRAGIVAKTSDYVYSSASNYINDDGILNIEKAENPVVEVLKSVLLLIIIVINLAQSRETLRSGGRP